jgi:aspartate racemase
LQTCEQFAKNYCQVLREILFHPDKTIAEIQLFSRDQRQQLVDQRNRRRTEYPRDKTLPALVEEQVRLRPTATAVRYEGRRLTYQQLNAKANQLAQHLREKGAGPEVLVGISVDRSLEMIIGLLAILKAGAAYVPIDLDYPPERQEMIVRDSGLKLLLVSHYRVESWPCGLEVIRLSPDQSDIAQQSRENPDSGVRPENLAYIMYTSGSTGIPKGVAVPHRAVVRLVKEANYVKLDSEEKILQFAPLNFDASTFEIWGSLLNGGELIVMSAGRPSLEALAATIRDNAITTIWLTSGLFDLMVDHCLEDLKVIRQLLAGGDVISVAHAERYAIANPHATLINGYGPTENTTFTCCGSLRAGTAIGNSVPIGSPISNTQVQILDCNFDLVPVGVVGELCAGGDGLARSYVNHPELTAEKFVPNPFCESPGERLYRTGDLARYCWDGSIEFVGRVDQQVKIRGYRIELSEIEAALKKHESVQACVVLHEESDSGDKHLTAYVVARDDLRNTELKRYLEEKLPAYMIPSELVKIKEMPLTDNGKIDRARLRTERAALQPAEEEESYVAPSNELEKAIAEVWKEVLAVERVGVFDNFFDLGGHSLLAMKICARMNGKLTCKARVTDLFLYPTIHSLSRHLALKKTESDIQTC